MEDFPKEAWQKSMGKLIIDGNSVYEIDEECLRKTHVPENCGLYPKQEQDKKEENNRWDNRKGRTSYWDPSFSCRQKLEDAVSTAVAAAEK